MAAKKKKTSSFDKYLTSPRRVGKGPSEMLGRPPIKESSPRKKPEIIISGPGKKDSQQHKIDALSDAGWSDRTIAEVIRTGNVGPAYEKLMENQEMDRFMMKPKKRKGGGKIISKRGGGMSHVGLYPAEEKHEGKTKATGTVSEATREENIKREAKGGGKVLETKKKKKKKQGYKDRKDESIAQRVKKKRTKKQLADSRDESYGKWGKGKGKGKINQTDGNKFVASLYD